MIAKMIKESLDTRRVVEYYGYKLNRQGLMKCPLHNEKSASFKVYQGDKGWHCYGCGKNGSVIDFVMNVFGLTLSQAILRLNYDFNLGFTTSKPTKREKDKMLQKMIEQKKIDEIKKLLKEYWTLEFKTYYRQYQDHKPVNKFDELDNKFIEALIKLPYIDHKLGGDCYF